MFPEKRVRRRGQRGSREQKEKRIFQKMLIFPAAILGKCYGGLEYHHHSLSGGRGDPPGLVREAVRKQKESEKKKVERERVMPSRLLFNMFS